MARKISNKPELTVEIIGKPSIDHLPKNEQTAFYSALAQMAVDYYRRKEKDKEANSVNKC